ncbi:type III-B CRISPR-associated protein Cas10/Cmr2 [Tolypothrix sp. PCC 7910]|uniref:type III-B CRISPR-associated protein Cas10/Cmr2 n=1 Tax=Tolypothrix sp. PCC 7910 TaxID=2099387 RepID=UPI00142771EF|nr:type III-B CRISPR-associated protein Cas10/Cmr2 [Tolypothrix sp. PCC 7910]QIR37247.1 type III-B CRISPR-associated protein Cas10/Cmr2 [Tolypothrix sp. PCC 7910]
MNFYQRKLYALLQVPNLPTWGDNLASQLECLQSDLPQLREWWGENNEQNSGIIGRQAQDIGSSCDADLATNIDQPIAARLAQDIGSSCDRLNLPPIQRTDNTQPVTVHHPISGQQQQVTQLQLLDNAPDISQIQHETDAKKVFWWFWRFYPELLANNQQNALLFPAHLAIPDCPLHSHQSTVSALTGAMFPATWQKGEPHQTPYLLVFTFSPVQEFIKSSRKFLDFWAGSYLLHYLSSRLCWHIAQQLGPDAVIIPSLWSQEIIDALIMQKYPDFASNFAHLQEDGKNPVQRFKDKISTSLSTAGFPNAITVLVSGEAEAKHWGKFLKDTLTTEWVKIGTQVKSHIRTQVIEFLDQQTPEKLEEILTEVFPEFKNTSDKLDPYRRELQLLKQQCCWEWRKLWEAQLDYTWEPYWTAIPLGNPEKPLAINKNNGNFDSAWISSQTEIARPIVDLPDEWETKFYTYFNVGTWWGSIQQRLRICLNDVKYTRNWQISTAPGERSSISGQFSALHPQLNYQVTTTLTGKTRDLRQGSGVAAGSLRLFWFVMSKAYPGLFNGSEKLNALELTKRMAWVYGGVAESLGIPIVLTEDPLPDEAAAELEAEPEASSQNLQQTNQIIDYEKLIRFPNLSSIAVAAFAQAHPHLIQAYRRNLYRLFKQHKSKFSRLQQRAFYSKTSRPSHIPNADKAIKEKFPDIKGGYNGVMFSSKWLIDDMGLQEQERIAASNNANSSNDQNKRKQVEIIREIVQQAHQATGFGDTSPADWWVILLADGDGMGDYVSGKKLNIYRDYVEEDAVDKSSADFNENLFTEFLNKTDKRMGPATHVGLNRALLDFSNRLVPYLTEKRFCGRVIYSGGDDVMVVLPIEDLPEYLLSLRAAWSGGDDPKREFESDRNGDTTKSNTPTGYWYPGEEITTLAKRPHFTMGSNATMSAGVVIAHKSVPLPTVLESLWTAESDRAKRIADKDGICFRVIYGGGNQLEALMKGELLESWWDWVKKYEFYQENLSPLLYRLAEELPNRASITDNYHLFSKAAKVIMESRDSHKQLDVFKLIENWLDDWEDWAKKTLEKWARKSLKEWAEKIIEQRDRKTPQEIEQAVKTLEQIEEWNQQPLEHWVKEAKKLNPIPVGTQPEDLAKLLRFTAFWIDNRVERWQWKEKASD